jgi:flagellar motor switch protein FliM
MKKGDFIELNREPKIKAKIDGVPIFECNYGTHNSKYAIRIDKSLRHVDNWIGDSNNGL